MKLALKSLKPSKRKWPFKRILGCDEFGSTLFSLGNLAGVVIGFMRAHSTKKSSFSNLVRFHAICSSIVWVLSGTAFELEFNFSSVIFLAQFHARDTVLSEQLDYFGAILLVYSTFTIVYARQLFRYDFTSWLLLLPLACFILHIYYLFYFLPKFDFGLNMQICVFLGLCTV